MADKWVLILETRSLKAGTHYRKILSLNKNNTPLPDSPPVAVGWRGRPSASLMVITRTFDFELRVLSD